jgi:hypothetical protein
MKVYKEGEVEIKNFLSHQVFQSKLGTSQDKRFNNKRLTVLVQGHMFRWWRTGAEWSDHYRMLVTFQDQIAEFFKSGFCGQMEVKMLPSIPAREHSVMCVS